MILRLSSLSSWFDLSQYRVILLTRQERKAEEPSNSSTGLCRHLCSKIIFGIVMDSQADETSVLRIIITRRTGSTMKLMKLVGDWLNVQEWRQKHLPARGRSSRRRLSSIVRILSFVILVRLSSTTMHTAIENAHPRSYKPNY